jgi:hypothetical protein
MLFRIIDITQKARKGTQDPKGFMREQIQGALFEIVIGPILGLILFLGLLFVLSYTHVLGGPYGLARFFFWFLTIVYVSVGYGLYKLYGSLKNTFTQKPTAEQPSSAKKVRDAEVVE